MADDRNAHIKGLLKLLHPDEITRTKRAFETSDGRDKFKRRLQHNIDMHPQFTFEPPKGCRDKDSLLKALEELGAPQRCYIIASDDSSGYGAHRLDDSFHSLRYTLEAGYWEFSHGTILSCIPGELALFRSAYPHRHYIVHRPKGR